MLHGSAFFDLTDLGEKLPLLLYPIFTGAAQKPNKRWGCISLNSDGQKCMANVRMPTIVELA